MAKSDVYLDKLMNPDAAPASDFHGVSAIEDGRQRRSEGTAQEIEYKPIKFAAWNVTTWCSDRTLYAETAFEK